MSSCKLSLCILACIYCCAHGQTSDEVELNRSHCVAELEAITEPFQLNLSDTTQISPNYSVASSVAYHNDTSTILIAGDFFYIDAKDPSKRTYYQYFQAFSHANNVFDLKYSKNATFNNPSFGNKFISHQSLRSWTRIIAHPSLPYFFLLGINNLTAYNVHNGDFLWTANIPPCSTHSSANDRPVIYNDATFFINDNENIYVAGSCVDNSTKTVVLLDEYSLQNGAWNSSFRQLYNLTDLGFFKSIDLLDGFGVIPPEITIKAPVNKTFVTTVENKYFYVAFTHVMFSGVARIEHDVVAGDWRVKKFGEDWTLVNPSFFSHRSMVTTQDGLITLLDPGINGIFSLFVGKMKHFTRFITKKSVTDQVHEDKQYNVFTWYGGHEKYDLHLDWTLSIDAFSEYQHIYVTTAPLQFDPSSPRNSTIAKHNFEKGDIDSGAIVPFFALDTIVTNENQVITVGFKWTPSMKDGLPFNFSLSGILPYLERKAVFQVFSNYRTEDSCIGCETDWYTKHEDIDRCGRRCGCENGYCNDTLYGDGHCYCTIMSYGERCRACDGQFGSCDPMKGICDSGPEGTGRCKFCYDLDIDFQEINESSIGLGPHYGPNCTMNCTCNTNNGICYTTGNLEDAQAGKCLYCTNSNAFGADCDRLCDCDSHTEYCSNGVSGTGCVKYDYGGLLTDKGWSFYTIIGSALFVVLFTITFLQTNSQYKKQHNGESLPWCPQKKRQMEHEDDEHNGFVGDQYSNGKQQAAKQEYQSRRNGQHNNDLMERMINDDRHHQHDPNEPPAVSRMVNDGNGVVIEQEQDDEAQQQRFNI